MYHTAYKGPEPVAYVDTGLYEDGHNEYYETFNERDLRWVHCMDYVTSTCCDASINEQDGVLF